MNRKPEFSLSLTSALGKQQILLIASPCNPISARDMRSHPPRSVRMRRLGCAFTQILWSESMKPCVCFFLMLLGLAPFSHGAGAPAFPPDCWGVYTWGGGRIDRAAYPHIKGFPITLNWANVEPRNGQFAFEESLGKSLRTAHENDFYVHLMLWVVPNSPQWLYENGVPKVDAPARINPFRREVKPDYPYYFDEDYKRFFHRLIRAFGDYVRNLPPELQSRVLFVQSAEGSTGDGQPYKSQPTNPKYRISPEQWSQFRMETWEVYRQA